MRSYDAVKYSPKISGDFHLSVSRSSVNILDSPFNVTVRPGATSAERSYSYGAGLCTAKAGDEVGR